MSNERMSEDLITQSKFIEIFDSKIHYLEAGVGDPIVFLHGIPMSSYVWRNIIPHLSMLGRCIAPDMIGFGLSGKPNIDYSILDHIKYLEKFIETLNLKNITLIMHGFGSVIGFNYAMHHENNCKGLVFYESFVRSLDGEEVSLPFQEQLATLSDYENASNLMMNGSLFIDKIIPQNIMQTLTEEEMNQYRQPFMEEGSSKPIQQYIKELTNQEDMKALDKLIADYTNKLMHSPLPKLLMYSVPGFITTIAAIMWMKDNLSNLEIVDIGEELHLGQESHPRIMGETISVWFQGVEQLGDMK